MAEKDIYDELFEAMDIGKNLIESFKIGIFQSLMQQQMSAEEYEAVSPAITDFMIETLSLENLKPYLADIYSSVLNEEEIIELTNFYKTEVGKKLVKNQVSISTDMTNATNSLFLKHGEKFESLMADVMKQFQ